MTSHGRAASSSVSAERAASPPLHVLLAFARQTRAVASAEIRKLVRDPTEVFSRSVQPILWLVVFGNVFGRLHAIPTGSISYAAFLAPGILAQSVLFTAIFYGIAIIWERDLGILHTLLVSPAYRSALVLGKALSAGARALAQAVIVAVVASAMGVRLRLEPQAIAVVLAAIVLGAALFATFSLVVACLVKTRERFMGIGQVLTMPLFFASNAIYPVDIMPGWLRVISRVNPLSYLVDALRAAMIPGASAAELPLDFAVLAIVLAAFVAIGARLYPTIAR